MGVRVPKDDEAAQVEDRIEFLTAEEIGRVTTCPRIPERARLAYTVAIYTGLRPGELWGLRWSDVHLDGDHPRLVVQKSRSGPTKGRRVREVPLLPPAREALRRWRGVVGRIGTALVWPGAGGRCHDDGYDAGWTGSYRPDGTQRPGHRELAGVRPVVQFKDLRHTCGSHLVSGTWGRAWSLHEVRDWLGHRSVTTTERYYARLVPGHLHAAARSMEDAWRTRDDQEEPRT
jgi:integrase